jgi:uridine kinase
MDTGLDDVLRRGVARDQEWMGSAVAAEARYRTKYIPGEARYLDEVRPAERAQVIIDNRDPAAPGVIIRARRIIGYEFPRRRLASFSR